MKKLSSSGSQYKRQATPLNKVTQDLKLSLGIDTLPSNTAKQCTPQHYDQSEGSGSGSGSESGSGPDFIPVDLSMCEGEGGTTFVASTVPPITASTVPVLTASK